MQTSAASRSEEKRRMVGLFLSGGGPGLFAVPDGLFHFVEFRLFALPLVNAKRTWPFEADHVAVCCSLDARVSRRSRGIGRRLVFEAGDSEGRFAIDPLLPLPVGIEIRSVTALHGSRRDLDAGVACGRYRRCRRGLLRGILRGKQAYTKRERD